MALFFFQVCKAVAALCAAVLTYCGLLPVLVVLRGVQVLSVIALQSVARCKRRRGQAKATPMTVQDAFMLLEKDDNLCNIVAVLNLEGPELHIEAFRALVNETLLVPKPGEASESSDAALTRRWPKLTQRPVRLCGIWHWEDVGSSFRLEQHVKEERCGADEASIAEVLARLQSQPMCQKRPLWDFRLARPPGGGNIVFVRFHHSIGDGVALVNMFLEATGNSIAAQPPKVGHRGLGKLLSWLLVLLLTPLEALIQICERGDGSGIQPRALRGKKRAAVSPPVPLARLKSVAQHEGCSVTAVSSACFGRALTAGRHSGHLQEGSAGSYKVWMPVSLARAKGKLSHLENNICFVPLELRGGSATDLCCIEQQLQRLKRGDLAFRLYLILQGAMTLLPLPVADAILNFCGNKAMGVMSSVPGPRTPLLWGKWQVPSLIFLVPQRARVAVGLSMVSCADFVRVGVSVDEAVELDPDKMLQGWMEALEELEAADALQREY
eukprot:CAMPEP_0178389720 /NCGR_PEP_ID=MMETSP0689_2-20121128/10272_1 /TAXON_ID=160604 /ORGANISM="Amphidinium massartii, Strain CS-259" /LENGTH=495 /DNA_ID=CAMNT_0020010199 /DNA_START=30 /DNA_END=1515 /DNA_ORIENTATION=-